MRQRPRNKIEINKIGIDVESAFGRKTETKKSNCSIWNAVTLIVVLLLCVTSIQLYIKYAFYGGSYDNANASATNNHFLREQQQSDVHPTKPRNSYDVLLKDTIDYGNLTNTNNGNPVDLSKLQKQINNLQSQITTLESKANKYSDNPRFFPFVIRDSRHLTPVQIDPDFHVFDYVDLTQARQPKSKHSQLLHNARVVVDEVLEAKRGNETDKKKILASKYAEKYEAPCQKYSIECYAEKVLQVFSYVLRKFPSVEYYFYVEADNDLCVPMTMVRDLALNEKRYYINTGIGFSGWIMSRQFLADFIDLYQNAILEAVKVLKEQGTTSPGKNATPPEIRPDVLASYYLTDKRAWTVTRQYWVSHTTLESLGIASLTVKDRRKGETGERMRLDKHLPRCLEPRRGKWKVSRRLPYLDPRDRFGWDYFDYDVCPNEVLFPCKGQDQLKQLVEDDLRVATESGALAKWKRIAEKNKKKEEFQKRKEEDKTEAQKKKDDEKNVEEKKQALRDDAKKKLTIIAEKGGEPEKLAFDEERRRRREEDLIENSHRREEERLRKEIDRRLDQEGLVDDRHRVDEKRLKRELDRRLDEKGFVDDRHHRDEERLRKDFDHRLGEDGSVDDRHHRGEKRLKKELDRMEARLREHGGSRPMHEEHY